MTFLFCMVLEADPCVNTFGASKAPPSWGFVNALDQEIFGHLLQSAAPRKNESHGAGRFIRIRNVRGMFWTGWQLHSRRG